MRVSITFMARILLCLILSLAVQRAAQSQSSTPLYQQVDSILGDLDFTEVTSQVLYNQGFDMWNWAYYDGSMPSDSAAHSASQWGWMQVQAVTSFLGSYDPLPDPEFYIDLIQDLTDDDPIPIATLWLDYHYLREDAVTEGLIYIDPVDSTLHDVFPRSESPYIRDTTFMGTALLHRIRVGSRQLVFMDTLLMGNIGLSYTISINLNDGVGWRSITLDTPISVTFDSVGTQYITIRFTDSNSREWYAKTQVEIIEDPTQQGGGGSFRSSGYSDVPDETITEISGVQLDIFFGNDCDKLLKPFIFIEGFNPSSLQNQTWKEMETRLNSPVYQNNEIITPTENTTWQDLYNSGYDVIYVDFADGAADIFDNGDIVRDVIEWVNAEKASNGSIEKNIVLGASMGGLCAYWALGSMEAAQEDHEVEKFITFDTPFRGANIPIGLQLMVKHMYGYPINSFRLLRDRVPFLKLAKEVFDLPATKQLLYFHAWEGTDDGFSTWRNDFYDQLFTVSVNNTEHIAISNGSGVGEGQLMTCGGIYLDVPYQSGGNFWGTFRIHKAEVRLVENFNPDQKLYEYSFYKRLLIGLTWEWGYFYGYDIPSIDCAPGGVSDFGVGGIIKNALGKDKEIEDLFPQPNRAAFCFVPTISSQNIADQSNFFLPFTAGSCTNMSINQCAQSRDDNYTSPYAGSDAHNQNHVVLTSDLATMLLNRFYTPELPSTISNFSFNFGEREPDIEVDPEVLSFTTTGNMINKNVDIYSTGKLLINTIDRLARTDVTANPQNDLNQHFDVFVLKNCEEEPSIISVYGGGELSIGEFDEELGLNTSNLVFKDESELIIGDEGDVIVNVNSKLIFEGFTKILIEDGGFINAKGSAQVILNEDSEMRVQSGGTLHISDESSLILKTGATLILEDGAIVQLEDGLNPDGRARIEVRGNLQIEGEIVFSGNGFFDFYDGHTISITPTTFELTGYAPNYRLIRVNNTNLNLTQNHIKFNEFKVELVGSGSVHAGNNKDVRVDAITFSGFSHTSTGLFVDGHRRIHVQDCRFEDLNDGLDINDNNGLFPGYHTVIDRTDFISNSIGVILNEMDQAYVRHCNFEGNGEGVLIGDLNQMYFLSTDFSTNTKGIVVWGDEQAQRIVVDNSIFYQNNFGLFSEGGGKFNLVLRNGTTLEENTVGALMLGAGMDPNVLDYGILIMDCAKLINNDIGIQGIDVVLMIDAYTNSHTDDPDYVRSNHFESDPANQLLFDICYDIRTLSNMTPIPARGNYWSFTVPVSGSVFPWKIKQCGGSPLSVQNPFNYTGYIEEAPEGCPSRLIEIDTEFEDCILFQGTIEEIDIAAEYFEGMKDWREQIDSMAYNESGDWYAHFETIYSYDPLDTTMTDVCKYYIYTSGAFATGSLSFGNKPYHGLNNPELENNTFDVYPNPFNSTEPVHLSYTSGASLELELLNVQGTVVYKQTLALSESLTTLKFPDLPAGVYVLKYMDIESGESGYQILTKL